MSDPDQYGTSSPQYGTSSPQYGNPSPQYGNPSPQYGSSSQPPSSIGASEQNAGGGFVIAEWSSMGSKIRTLFTSYRSACEEAKQKDINEMAAGEQRIRAEYDSGPSPDTEQKANDFRNSIIKTAEDGLKSWDEFDKFYTDNFEPSVYLAKHMDNRRKSWEDDVEPKLGNFEEQLAQSKIAEAWQGKAADGYRKQLAPQTKAMMDMKVSAANGRVAMVTSRNVQMVIFNKIYASVEEAAAALATVDPSPDDNLWGERSLTFAAYNAELLSWIKIHKTTAAPWDQMQSELIQQLTDAREGNAELTQTRWPAATQTSDGYVPVQNAGGAQGPDQPGQASTGDQGSGVDGDTQQGVAAGDND